MGNFERGEGHSHEVLVKRKNLPHPLQPLQRRQRNIARVTSQRSSVPYEQRVMGEHIPWTGKQTSLQLDGAGPRRHVIVPERFLGDDIDRGQE